jgi:hypothetical protein
MSPSYLQNGPEMKKEALPYRIETLLFWVD